MNKIYTNPGVWLIMAGVLVLAFAITGNAFWAGIAALVIWQHARLTEREHWTTGLVCEECGARLEGDEVPSPHATL